MDNNSVAALAVLIIFGAPVAAWIVSRVFAHTERMEMIRRGVVPPPIAPDPWTMKHAMKNASKYGWVPGSPMPPGAFGPYGPYDPAYYAQRQLRRGVQVAFVGLALLIGLGFIGYQGNGTFEPGPWLLGGLIPMFVGIAQIIGAVLGGAHVGTFNAPGATTFGPPPQQPSASDAPSAQATPPAGGYGGWRPGTTPEIEKPVSPPDYRG